MKLREFLQQWGLDSLKLDPGFQDQQLKFEVTDRAAAWDVYVELLTRITTQELASEQGDEQTALESVFALFSLTREALKKHGSGSIQFAKVAIPVLNQVVRPFTARWHKLLLAKAFDDAEKCKQFRAELTGLQKTLRGYCGALSEIAGVENLTSLES